MSGVVLMWLGVVWTSVAHVTTQGQASVLWSVGFAAAEGSTEVGGL